MFVFDSTVNKKKTLEKQLNTKKCKFEYTMNA